MPSEALYDQLCAKLALPQSQRLREIWKRLCSPEEAALALALPGNGTSLIATTGMGAESADAMLAVLFHKGVVFKGKKDGAVIFKLAKNLIQLHDSSLLWEGADDGFMNLWKGVMDEDFPRMLASLPDGVTLPSFMRVIPVNQAVSSQSGVLPIEECLKIVDRAERLAVVRCPCRLSQKKCDAPVETCLQLDRGADYALDRGHGRAVTKEEARDILAKAEEAGLVHMTENRGMGNAICNCCSCCCEMFRLVKTSGKKWIMSPSRFLAKVDEGACTACGQCADVCPVGAIALEDVARVSADLCVGCGLCAGRCPADAITLGTVRAESHIPA